MCCSLMASRRDQLPVLAVVSSPGSTLTYLRSRAPFDITLLDPDLGLDFTFKIKDRTACANFNW